MRIILFLILSAVFALDAFGQDAERIQKDGDGNMIAIFGNQDPVDQSVMQEGAENTFFIYSSPDSLAGDIESNQLGFSNRIISIIMDGKDSLFHRFDQKGERNNIQVLRVSSSDSTVSGSNEIDIKQKGNGNSVTITQQ